MGCRHSQKFSTKYYINITPEERLELLEVWDRISQNIPSYNENIMRKFFEVNPEYQKYFIVAVKCEASKLCENVKVFRHWEAIIELLGYVLKHLYEKKCIDDTLSYIALFHKDMSLNINDFKKYTTVFIACLNLHQKINLSRNLEMLWIKFMNSIFRILCDKMYKFQTIELTRDDLGNLVVLTPEVVIRRDKHFWRKKSISCSDFSLPRAFTYYNKEYWIQRKEFWLQQIYWFSREQDDSFKKVLNVKRLSINDENSESINASTVNKIPSTSFDNVVKHNSQLIEKMLEDSGTNFSLIIPEKQKSGDIKQQTNIESCENGTEDLNTLSNLSWDATKEVELEISNHNSKPNSHFDDDSQNRNIEARRRRRLKKSLDKNGTNIQDN